jgi:hypothetical protein
LRLLYGLDRLPRTLSADDARLPAVDLGAAPLRLNSVPLPVAAWGSGTPDHAARMTAMRSWLLASCGDYNRVLHHAITSYLDAVAVHVAHNHDTLAAGLAPYQGLYQVEDWCWSAPRPLPRAWWRQDGAWMQADLAFWIGDTVIALPPGDLGGSDLPPAFQHFWQDQILPVSPFRRAFPAGPDDAALRASFP